MQKDIHPAYQERTVTCNCGFVRKVATTADKDFNIDICSHCHPFYTGKQKTVESRGRVDRYNRKYVKGHAQQGSKSA